MAVKTRSVRKLGSPEFLAGGDKLVTSWEDDITPTDIMLENCKPKSWDVVRDVEPEACSKRDTHVACVKGDGSGCYARSVPVYILED